MARGSYDVKGFAGVNLSSLDYSWSDNHLPVERTVEGL